MRAVCAIENPICLAESTPGSLRALLSYLGTTSLTSNVYSGAVEDCVAGCLVLLKYRKYCTHRRGDVVVLHEIVERKIDRFFEAPEVRQGDAILVIAAAAADVSWCVGFG